ncbi:MAG TPA: DUF6760 family protein [Candidatus Bathyarchaeia archaeon]|nr:DUF6760 family protein [Candidatus Bathyarchaeia archaeon]
MLACLPGGVERGGGVVGYPLQTLFEEVAFVAYHFHWPPETIVNLPHSDRLRWVKEISAINERMNKEQSKESSLGATFS